MVAIEVDLKLVVILILLIGSLIWRLNEEVNEKSLLQSDISKIKKTLTELQTENSEIKMTLSQVQMEISEMKDACSETSMIEIILAIVCALLKSISPFLFGIGTQYLYLCDLSLWVIRKVI